MKKRVLKTKVFQVFRDVFDANGNRIPKEQRKFRTSCIGEWCDGWRGVFDTVRRAMIEWRDNVEYMSEFVLCVNWKSWEHFGREHHMWAKFYGLLYEGVRDLMYDYYEGDDEKTSYMWRYLD